MYWDANCWIGLIRKEGDKLPGCMYIINEAEAGRVEILTSSFTLAEVYKVKGGAGIADTSDSAFEKYLELGHILRVQLDDAVGTEARRLLRRHKELKKPPDAIHLATALLNNVEELHTFDDKNLLKLDGVVPRHKAPGYMTICRPVAPPPDPKQELPGIFEPTEQDEERDEAADPEG